MLAILRYLVRRKSLKACVKIATITIPRFLFFSFFYCTGFFLFLFLFFACLFFLIAVRGFSLKKVGYEYISKTFFLLDRFFSFFDLFAFLLRWKFSVPKMLGMDISLISLFFDFVLMKHILFCVFPRECKQIFLS